MKIKYYLRGIGLGLIVGALVAGTGRIGASVSDASSADSAAEGNKTLSQVAMAEAADGAGDAETEPEDGDGAPDGAMEGTADSAKGNTPADGGSSADGGLDAADPVGTDQVDAWAGAGSEGDPDSGNTGRSGGESSSSDTTGQGASNTDSEKKNSNKSDGSDTAKADNSNSDPDSVGSGLPLSQREKVFTGENDAPGTRAARGEAGSNKGSNTSSDSRSKAESTRDVSSDRNSGTVNSNSRSQDSGQAGPNVSTSSTYTLSIYPGEGSYTVSRKLASLGLVESPDVYDTFLCQNGYDKKIRTGNYEILMGATPEQIARIITGAADR